MEKNCLRKQAYLICCLIPLINTASACENSPMIHPNRINIPKEIPFVARPPQHEKNGSRNVIPAAIDYQSGHYLGWQEALKSLSLYGLEETASEKHKTNSLVFASPSEYFDRGLSDGYDNCVNRYKQLINKRMDKVGLSESLTNAYQPLTKPPIQKDKIPSTLQQSHGSLTNPESGPPEGIIGPPLPTFRN